MARIVWSFRTYDSTAKTFSYKASTMSAAQACKAEGGYYDPSADYRAKRIPTVLRVCALTVWSCT